MCSGLSRAPLSRAPLSWPEVSSPDVSPTVRGHSVVISPHGPQPPQLGDEPPLYDDGALRITQLPGPGSGYALAGEIDEAAFPALARRLDEIAADLDEVHLNLADLDYTDLAGLRVIVGLADACLRGVVLHQVRRLTCGRS